MKNRFASLSLILLLAATASAQDQQKTLWVEDITPKLSVYPCGDRHEALVVIRCSEPFDLDFSSNVDLELKVDTASEGSEKIYNIVFETRKDGTSFKGRKLGIIAPNFKKYYLSLELNDKEKWEYLVTDPYSRLRSLFYTAQEDGINLFVKGSYDFAKDQFLLAKECPEYKITENSVDAYVAKCDSMMRWQNVADSLITAGDANQAKAMLEQMIYTNPDCSVLREQYSTVVQEYNRQYAYDLTVGEQYMLDKKYDLARERFEHLVSIKAPQSASAALKLEEISLINYKVDNHTRALFWQTMSDMSIGFTSASLNPDKKGGYFSMGFNSACVDFLSGKLVAETQAPQEPVMQAIASAGWTLRVYYPKNQFIPHVWAMFTPFSYAGGGYVLEQDDETTYKWYNAVAPEIGIAIKSWRIVLNYKLQYRYVINTQEEAEDFLGGVHHSFGIGFCW